MEASPKIAALSPDSQSCRERIVSMTMAAMRAQASEKAARRGPIQWLKNAITTCPPVRAL